MKNMSLEKIAQACGGVYHGSEEMIQSIVESITTDSRQAAKGCLFVAIPGERVDGHDFISQNQNPTHLQVFSNHLKLHSNYVLCTLPEGLHSCKHLR